MSQATLNELLARPGPVLLDGATGTELLRRGVKTRLPLWSAHALLDERGQEVLQQVHSDYVRAGADLIVTNTFRTNPRTLERAGRAGEWRLLNRRAVESARRAAETSAPRTCLVAGGLAPLEDCYRPEITPPEESCYREHREQALLLAELGVDLLFLETFGSATEARAALRAATDTGLDILLSLCPKAPAHLLSGEPLTAVVPELLRTGGKRLCGLLLNCATPKVMDVVYPQMAELVGALPHGLYAHLGEPDDRVGWKLPAEGHPQAYADWLRTRITTGTRFLGGCCGTTPAHVSALRALVSTI